MNAQEKLDSVTTVLTDQIEDVFISSTALKGENTIALSRKQFLTLAGALEDPTRLLIKFPGISTVNDQANSVIYHGMPSQYHRWSLYGARILNPNHLGNAGTISDFPSRTAGGVNMLSGQVIGNLEFNGSPSGKSLDALAASSDIKLRDPYKNGLSTNLGLIGLEVGIDRVSKDGARNFLLNYRYSTVGLLTSLGLDFGGEVINYQDITGKFSSKLANGGQFSAYFSGGINSNSKDPIPLGSQPEEYKDLQEIEYDALNLVGGLHYSLEKEKFRTNHTLNLSLNNTDRTALIPTSSIQQVTNSEYHSRELLLASKHDYTIVTEKIAYGMTIEPYLHSIELTKEYPDRSQEFLNIRVLDRKALHVIPTLHLAYKLAEGITLDGRAGIQSVFSSKNNSAFVGKLGISRRYANFGSSLNVSRSNQIFQPEILIYPIGADFIESNSVELNTWYKWIQLSLFYHAVSNIPISDKDYGFSAMENLDNLPLANMTDPIFLDAIGKADIYGVSLSINKNIGGIEFNGNITLTDSEQELVAQTSKAPLDYGHVLNLGATKNWKFKSGKQFGISVSFHHRGGARQNQIDLNRSFQWGYTNYSFENQYNLILEDYVRMDLRILYKPSKRSTISLDIQNVLNRENDAYYYYEPYWGDVRLRKQLGMIPILSWRVNW